MATLNTVTRLVPKEYRNKRIYTGKGIYTSVRSGQGADVVMPGYFAGKGLDLTEDNYFIAVPDDVTLGFNAWLDINIKDGGVDTQQLAADAVDGTIIADDAIDSEHYVDGSIDLAHLAADSVDGTKIADDAIDSEHYVDGSIDLAHLAADSVDGTKIADDAIDSEHITNYSIDNIHMASDSVDNANIVNDAVTMSKIADYTLTGRHNINTTVADPSGSSAWVQADVQSIATALIAVANRVNIQQGFVVSGTDCYAGVSIRNTGPGGTDNIMGGGTPEYETGELTSGKVCIIIATVWLLTSTKVAWMIRYYEADTDQCQGVEAGMTTLVNTTIGGVSTAFEMRAYIKDENGTDNIEYHFHYVDQIRSTV